MHKIKTLYVSLLTLSLSFASHASSSISNTTWAGKCTPNLEAPGFIELEILFRTTEDKGSSITVQVQGFTDAACSLPAQKDGKQMEPAILFQGKYLLREEGHGPNVRNLMATGNTLLCGIIPGDDCEHPSDYFALVEIDETGVLHMSEFSAANTYVNRQSNEFREGFRPKP